MSNELCCGDCDYYYEIQKPKPRGGFKSLNHGHCLAKSVYAKGKPGKPVYPPGATIKELPYGQHNVFIVRKETLVPHCVDMKRSQ